MADRRKRFACPLAAFMAVVWLISWNALAHAAASVTLVLSDSSSLYQETALALATELEKDSRGWQVRIQPLAERHRTESEDMVVPLGLKALQSVLAEPANTQVWSLLVPRLTFEHLVATQPAASRRPVSALYLDQPLARQLQMLQAALPHAKRLGVLLGPTSAALAEPLRAAAAEVPLEVVSEIVHQEADLIPTLGQLRGRVDALLMLPDPVVMNRSTLQALLLHTYRLRLPVAAYSIQLIEAGVMLALYASPSQIGQEAGVRLRQAWGNGDRRPPTSAHPDSFDVAVNRSVAQSLDIRVPTGEVIRQRMNRSAGR